MGKANRSESQRGSKERESAPELKGFGLTGTMARRAIVASAIPEHARQVNEEPAVIAGRSMSDREKTRG